MAVLQQVLDLEPTEVSLDKCIIESPAKFIFS